MTTADVAVVGASGRVGAALVEYFEGRRTVVGITHEPGEPVTDLAVRAAEAGQVVVNAAGVAHVEIESPAEVERLRAGNVELPVALATAALARARPLIHISSAKATADADTAYGASKFEGDTELELFGSRFADADLQLVVVRPLALLFPPFEAGKLSKLRPLRRLPHWIVLPLSMPVISTATFLGVMNRLVQDAGAQAIPGFRVYDFDKSERGTMRDVHAAISTSARREELS